MPSLFVTSSTPVAEAKRVGEGLQTPFGAVRFTASADGRDIAGGHTDRWRMGDDAWLDRWESAGIELERLTCRLRPELPDGMRVDDCWGVLWRFLAHREISRFTVAARLLVPVPDGSGDSGEDLEAVEFESETCRMHIGTQDAEALADRAYAGTLPARWWRDYEVEGPAFATLEEAVAAPHSVWTPRWYESLPPLRWWEEAKATLRDIRDAIRPAPPTYPEDTFPIEIDPDGLIVSLPPLEPGDRGELQFLVAWVARRDLDDASTWYAVDWGPTPHSAPSAMHINALSAPDRPSGAEAATSLIKAVQPRAPRQLRATGDRGCDHRRVGRRRDADRPRRARAGPAVARLVVLGPAAQLQDRPAAERPREPLDRPHAAGHRNVEELADACGYPECPLGYKELGELATRGWAAAGNPQFGAFKYVHTNPDFSTSEFSGGSRPPTQGARHGRYQTHIGRPHG